jgi:hypothetical protein
MPLEQDEHVFEHLLEVHHQPLGYGVMKAASNTIIYLSRTPDETPSIERPGEARSNCL